MKDENAWYNDFDIANEIYENCDICKKFQKTPPRPAVALPLANGFNDTVAIDLNYWKNNLSILYDRHLQSIYIKVFHYQQKTRSTY